MLSLHAANRYLSHRRHIHSLSFLTALSLVLLIAACGGSGGGGGGSGGGGGGGAATVQADPWTIEQMNPAYNDVVYAAGTYVAVGTDGAVATSIDDGATWTRQLVDLPTADTFTAVTHDGTNFLAVTEGGNVATSTDGASWSVTAATSLTGTCSMSGFWDVAYDGTQFLTVSTHTGGVCTSTDGHTWNQANFTSGKGEVLAYDATLGYIASISGESTFLAGSSPGSMNLVDLDPFSTNPSVLQDIAIGVVGSSPGTLMMIAVGASAAYDGGAAGSVITAVTDLTVPGNYTVQAAGSPATTLNAVAIGGGTAVAVGDNGEVYTSTDGATWAAQTSATTETLQAVAFNGGATGLAAAGVYNSVVTGDAAGVTWTSRESGSGPAEIVDLEYAPGPTSTYLVSARPPDDSLGCAVWTATDPASWTDRTASIGDCVAGDVAWNDTLGQWGIYDRLNGAVAFSSDGTGTSFTAMPHDFSAGRAIHAVGTEMVALGANGVDDMILHGADPATTLTVEVTDANGIQDYIYDGSAYVGGASDGSILTSSDGLTWSASTTSAASAVNAIAYDGSGAYVLVGDSGLILHTATPAGTWSIPTTGVTGSPALRDVIWDGSQFVAVGDGNVVAFSTDGGDNWTMANPSSVPSDNLHAVANNGTVFVAVGENATRYRVDTSGSALDTVAASWTDVSGTGLNTYRDVIWSSAQSRFVAVGSDSASASADGSTWSDVIPVGTIANLASVSDPVSGTVVYALGAGGTMWHIPDTGAATVPQYGEHERMAVLNGEFVTYGEFSGFVTVYDDVKGYWVRHTVQGLPTVTDPSYADDGLATLAYADAGIAAGTYVAADSQLGEVYTSADLTTWTKSPGVAFGGAGTEIVFGNTRFVGSDAATVKYSDDGVTWLDATVDFPSVIGVGSSICYEPSEGRFLASSGNLVYRDAAGLGESWVPYDPVLPDNVGGIVAGNGEVLLTGQRGLVASHAVATFP